MSAHPMKRAARRAPEAARDTAQHTSNDTPVPSDAQEATAIDTRFRKRCGSRAKTHLHSIERGAGNLDTVSSTADGLGCGQNPAATVSVLDIRRLGKLPELEYDRCRKIEAKKLGVRVSTLDAEVLKVRAPASSLTPGGQGGVFDLPDLAPWPDPVDGAVLLDEIAATFRRFAVLPDHADEVLALWCVMTHAIDVITVAPIIAITSPEKGCGKSTVLDILSRLVRRPLPVSNVTSAALFRSIEKWSPTMIVDEADTFIRDNDELRGVLNSGHIKATAYILRCVGEEAEPRRFSTWGAKAIAAINKLPETLADRSIQIRLRRALPDERVDKIRRAGSQGFERLARMAARWVADNTTALRHADPALPEGLSNRAGDNAEPLLAIADLAGGPWGERARRAILRLSGLSDDGESIGVQLLRDVLAVFVQRGVDRLPTKEIVEALAADELAPWRTFDSGRPISPRQLARKLGEFGISPANKRGESGVLKGYERGEIEDQARRYLPKTTP